MENQNASIEDLKKKELKLLNTIFSNYSPTDVEELVGETYDKVDPQKVRVTDAILVCGFAVLNLHLIEGHLANKKADKSITLRDKARDTMILDQLGAKVRDSVSPERASSLVKKEPSELRKLLMLLGLADLLRSAKEVGS